MFWSTTAFHIQKITSHAVPLDSKITLLYLWDTSSIQSSSKELISFLLLAAKCLIAKLWKSPSIPSIKSWYQKIWDIIVSDKISDYILTTEMSSYQSCFLEKWIIFFTYLENFPFSKKWLPSKYKSLFYSLLL